MCVCVRAAELRLQAPGPWGLRGALGSWGFGILGLEVWGFGVWGV